MDTDASRLVGALVAGRGLRIKHSGAYAVEMVVNGRFVASVPLGTTSQGFRTAFTLHAKSAHISMGAVPQ
jgi:hypothetical protein